MIVNNVRRVNKKVITFRMSSDWRKGQPQSGAENWSSWFSLAVPFSCMYVLTFLYVHMYAGRRMKLFRYKLADCRGQYSPMRARSLSKNGHT
jgi:hypothetical protein